MIITKSKFAAKLTLPVRTEIFDAVTSNTLNPHLSECVMLGHPDIQKARQTVKYHFCWVVTGLGSNTNAPEEI